MANHMWALRTLEEEPGGSSELFPTHQLKSASASSSIHGLNLSCLVSILTCQQSPRKFVLREVHPILHAVTDHFSCSSNLSLDYSGALWTLSTHQPSTLHADVIWWPFKYIFTLTAHRSYLFKPWAPRCVNLKYSNKSFRFQPLLFLLIITLQQCYLWHSVFFPPSLFAWR